MRPADEQRAKLRYLEDRFATLWGGEGAVAEAFGAAWSAAEAPRTAIAWYERALKAQDGTASLRAAEQLGNLRVREAWEAARGPSTAPTPTAARSKRQGVVRARGKRGDDAVRAKALTAARAAIKMGIAQLDRVAAIEPSIERLSLLGSAWKRQAMLAALAGDQRDQRAAIAHMQRAYADATELARIGGDAELFYPALNRIAADVAGAEGRRIALDAGLVERVLWNLAAKNRDAPTFWSVAGLADLRTYEALARAELATALPTIEREYDDLHQRCDAAWLWKSVADQADFILPIYAAFASPAERKAAESLRESLAKKAGVKR